MNAKDPHEILGVSVGATVPQLRQAYRQLALKWHPDKHMHGKDKELAIDMFAKITNAYQVLIDDFSRPSNAGKSKIHTRIPTPVPSFGSSRRSPTSTTSSSVSQLLTPHSKEDFFNALPRSAGINKAEAKEPNEFPRNLGQTFEFPNSRNHITIRNDNATAVPGRRLTPAPRLPPHQHHATPPPYSTLPRADGLHDNSHHFHDKSKRPFSHRTAQDPMVVRYLDTGENSQLLISGPPLRSIGLGPSGEWAYCLTMTLEELFSGKHCRFCVVRNFLSGRSKNVVLEIDVPPGCQDGMRILCREVGHELTPRKFQDVAFVIEQAPHPRFTRAHDDLYLEIRLAWGDVISQPLKRVGILGIDGKEIGVVIDCDRGNVFKGELSIGGAGMVREGSGLRARGNLIVRWEVQTPQTRFRRLLGRFWHSRTGTTRMMFTPRS